MRGEIVPDRDLEGPPLAGERLGPRGVGGSVLGGAADDDWILAGAAQGDDLGELLARLGERRRSECAEADLASLAAEPIAVEPVAGVTLALAEVEADRVLDAMEARRCGLGVRLGRDQPLGLAFVLGEEPGERCLKSSPPKRPRPAASPWSPPPSSGSQSHSSQLVLDPMRQSKSAFKLAVPTRLQPAHVCAKMA